MRKVGSIFVAIGLCACASNPVAPPNSIRSQFDPQISAVRVTVSDLQPLVTADLLSLDGSRVPATAITPLSGPHVDYNPPPSIGLGIGGFGFSGGGGFGSGLGVGLPVGRPSPSHIDDQYLTSAVIPVPPNYGQTWNAYRLELQVGNRPLVLAAPAPGAGA
jgi:hypothetical protein